MKFLVGFHEKQTLLNLMPFEYAEGENPKLHNIQKQEKGRKTRKENAQGANYNTEYFITRTTIIINQL